MLKCLTYHCLRGDSQQFEQEWRAKNYARISLKITINKRALPGSSHLNLPNVLYAAMNVPKPHELDLSQEFDSMKDLKQVVQQWSLLHGVAMKIKYSGKNKEFVVVCPSSQHMTKKEKAEKNACKFCISAYYRPQTAKVTFSKKCNQDHDEDCCEVKLKTVGR